MLKRSTRFCKGININGELIITRGSDLLILQSVKIFVLFCLYSNCESSHKYTCSVDNHMYIHKHMYVRAVI